MSDFFITPRKSLFNFIYKFYNTDLNEINVVLFYLPLDLASFLIGNFEENHMRPGIEKNECELEASNNKKFSKRGGHEVKKMSMFEI